MKFNRILFVIFIALLSSSILSQSIDLKKSKNISEINKISGYSLSGNIITKIQGALESKLYENISDEGSLIKIDGTEFRFEAGKPVIPQKSLHYSLKGCYQIDNVSLVSGTVREGKTKKLIMRHPKRIRKAGSSDIDCETMENSPGIFKTDEFYPAEWLTFTAGYDGNFTHVYIQLYPVQWNPTTYELLFLNDYVISINGRELSDNRSISKFTTVNDRHIILSPDTWISTADSIAQFHNSQGMPTAVINVDDIYQTYSAVGDPAHPGYANMTNSEIHDYNYTDAKKITAYLRDGAAHPNAELVTILGAGEIIPPSYYFYIPVNVMPSRAAYLSWIPSDQYYSSPDYDWIDNYAVNRVSVHTENELIDYYHKMVNWNNQLQGTWVTNASLSGGIPCGTNYFLGELCNNHIICSDIFNGLNIQKFQHHMGNYSASNILDHLAGDDILFHYNDSHGSGLSVYFDDDSGFGVEELSDLPVKERLPVFLSLSCMNGNFDTECVDNPWGLGMSFAEGLITSPGGGIAYIGGARYTTGDVLTQLDNGNIRFLGQNQLYALLFHYLQAYRHVSTPYLGTLFKAAKDSFLLHQDMTVDNAKVAYVQFHGICDAALLLPDPPAVNPENNVPDVSVTGALTDHGNAPQFVNLNSNENPVYSINGSDQYDLMTVNISGKTVNQSSNIGNSFIVQNISSNQLILNKVINPEGKEAWHYSIVNKGLKKVDGDLSDWTDGETVGNDDSGDIAPDKFDLTSFYAAYDEENNTLNFALPVNPCSAEENLYYIIAIDDQPSYGFQNNYLLQESFPFPIYLGFDNATINKMIVIQTNPTDYFESPYEISKYKYYRYYLYNDRIYWFDYPIDGETVSGIAFSDSNTIEITVPAGLFDLTNFKMAVFSSVEEGIIEDVIPTSLSSPSVAQYGIENAYSISSFIDGELISAIDEKPVNIISGYNLYQNYPNPFNPETTIKYELTKSADVTLKIYNVLGQEVRTLVTRKQPAGIHFTVWNGRNDKNVEVASGIYVYKLMAEDFIATRKMVLLR